MPYRHTRLLCTGDQVDRLLSQSAVLRQAGYEVQAATLPEAEILLRAGKFDLIIISEQLAEREKARILSAAGGTPHICF